MLLISDCPFKLSGNDLAMKQRFYSKNREGHHGSQNQNHSRCYHTIAIAVTKMDDDKCWQGCDKEEALMLLVGVEPTQPVWKSGEVPAIILQSPLAQLGDSCPPVLTASLFAIPSNRNKCLLTDEWKNKMWNLYTMDHSPVNG